MKFFKQNPLFVTLLAVFTLLFIGGVVMIFVLSGQSAKEAKALKSAETSLRGALTLSPAPTSDNIEAAEANVKALRAVLEREIQSTRGSKPALLKGKAPASGTEMLFQLEAYKNEFLREAKRTVPINVGEKELEIMKKEGVEPPSVKVPDGFNFGFSRYLASGEPPSASQIPVIYQQKEILTYLLRKLLSTRPISIVSVQREPVAGASAEPAKKNAGKVNNSAQGKPDLMSDEFAVGAESARVKGAVETQPFKIVFTGYTENLRSFLKQIETFELPLVVRSVEVSPVESSVKTGASAQAKKPDDIFSIFGASQPATTEAKPAIPDRVEVVSEMNPAFRWCLSTLPFWSLPKTDAAEDLP